MRARVVGIRDRLARGLYALAGAALGHLPFTAQRLEAYAALAVPLLGSPLVGEGAAFTAAHALAASLPGELGHAALAVASSLRLVTLCEHGGARLLGTPPKLRGVSSARIRGSFSSLVSLLGVPSPPGCEAEVELPERAPVVETVQALASATAGGRPLPTPAYTFLFPVLRAMLSWPQHTARHEQALAAVALHVAPGGALPRAALLALLYRVLDLMPAYRRAALVLLQLYQGTERCECLRRWRMSCRHSRSCCAQGQGAAAAGEPVRGPACG